jgi:hypothetical protein
MMIVDAPTISDRWDLTSPSGSTVIVKSMTKNLLAVKADEGGASCMACYYPVIGRRREGGGDQ